MNTESLTTTLAIVSILANVIAVGVVLYVKSRIGPILTQLITHEKLLEHRRLAESEQWNQLAELRERIARLETKRGTTVAECKG